MKKIEDKIFSVIEKYSMISAGDTVILAVSGGADSMCLLHFFNKYSRILNINIIVAHVNHGIRGNEAKRDEEFVRNYCEQNSIDLRVAHFNVPEISQQTGESAELCGRRLRYEFFDSINSDAKIATAHNLNDSMETFIFNLSRGTGLKGLTGIPVVRGKIIRPISECTRNEIELYLSEEEVGYVTDSTNLVDDYSRNKIRHKIIPVLNELNPSFSSVFTTCLSTLTASENYLASVTETEFERLNNNSRFPVCELILLDDVIKNRVIIKICESFGCEDVSHKHIEIINAFLTKGGAVMLSDSITVASDGKYLYKSEKKDNDTYIYTPLTDGVNVYHFDRCDVIIDTVDKSEISNYNIKKLHLLGYADGDRVVNAVFRSRISGDRFKYPNSQHSKSLKNLYKEKNITSQARNGIPMLANDDNILWIYGVGTSEFAKITDKTVNIVKISIVDFRKVE